MSLVPNKIKRPTKQQWEMTRKSLLAKGGKATPQQSWKSAKKDLKRSLIAYRKGSDL